MIEWIEFQMHIYGNLVILTVGESKYNREIAAVWSNVKFISSCRTKKVPQQNSISTTYTKSLFPLNNPNILNNYIRVSKIFGVSIHQQYQYELTNRSRNKKNCIDHNTNDKNIEKSMEIKRFFFKKIDKNHHKNDELFCQFTQTF